MVTRQHTDGDRVHVLRRGEVVAGCRHICERCGRAIPTGDPCVVVVYLTITPWFREVVSEYRCTSRCT